MLNNHNIWIGKFAEVDNVSWKCNGAARSLLWHFLRAITFSISNFDTVITCNNGSNELEAIAFAVVEAITFLHCAKALCDNAFCNVALSL
jgi:hypothetical protein